MSRAKILVVDDEPAMLRSVARVLEGSYEVVSARTPLEALDLAPSVRPDLAILDIRMPEMDGFELMGRLKAIRPDLDLIVMTGSVTETDAKLIRSIREKAFYFIQKPFDREVLRTLVARCLELRRLTEANRRHVARLEGELKEARTFQQSLLPPGECRIEGVAIAARYLPCSELGGDFFDYAAAGPGRTALLMADVSGHGASAAMLTGIVKAAFHSAQPDGFEPRAVISKIAASMRTLADNMMVTAFCARIESREQRLEYVNAGHPPAILWSTAAPELLASTGPLISPVFPASKWQTQVRPYTRADRLLLYTDGIVEAPGEEGEFGLDRVIAFLRSRGPACGPELLDGLLHETEAFLGGRPAQDDLTLLCAHLEE